MRFPSPFVAFAEATASQGLLLNLEDRTGYVPAFALSAFWCSFFFSFIFNSFLF